LIFLANDSDPLGGRSQQREIIGRSGDVKRMLDDENFRTSPNLPACRTSIATISFATALQKLKCSEPVTTVTQGETP
jgi:hypothetical protein